MSAGLGAVKVVSSQGPQATVIDGGGTAPVATFSSGEGLSSILEGFTLQHGTSTPASQLDGGGVYINNSSPTIQNNVIAHNLACDAGGGIAVYHGSPAVTGNTISDNHQAPTCQGGVGGGGIADGKAEIAVWRPSDGTWYLRGVSQTVWGANGDIPA